MLHFKVVLLRLFLFVSTFSMIAYGNPALSASYLEDVQEQIENCLSLPSEGSNVSIDVQVIFDLKGNPQDVIHKGSYVIFSAGIGSKSVANNNGSMMFSVVHRAIQRCGPYKISNRAYIDGQAIILFSFINENVKRKFSAQNKTRKTFNEKVRQAAMKCWSILPSHIVPDLTIIVRVYLGARGNVRSVEALSAMSKSAELSALWNVTAAVKKAILKCGPYELLRKKYRQWRVLNITFRPKDISMTKNLENRAKSNVSRVSKNWLKCAVPLLALAGCSEENAIRDAVVKYTHSQPGHCITYGLWPFNKTIGSLPSASPKQAKFLASLGFLSVKFLAFRSEGKLTEKGKQYYFPDVKNDNPMARGFGIGRGGLCIGEQELVSIDNFTEPTNLQGLVVTTVSYKYKISKLPQWSKSTAFFSVFEDSRAVLLARTISSKIQLIKTNKGWTERQ